MKEFNYEAKPYTFDYDPIPDGIYIAQIIGGEEKKSQYNEDESYISLKFEIAGGDCDKRLIFLNLYLNSSNPISKEIAYKHLDGIAYALDTKIIHSYGEMFRKRMKVRILSKKSKNSDTIYSNINRFYTMADNPVFRPIQKEEAVPNEFKFPEKPSHKLDTTTPKASEMEKKVDDDEDLPF